MRAAQNALRRHAPRARTNDRRFPFRRRLARRHLPVYSRTGHNAKKTVDYAAYVYNVYVRCDDHGGKENSTGQQNEEIVKMVGKVARLDNI